MNKSRGIDSYSQSVLSVSAPLAWLYVSLLGASYICCTLLLHHLAPSDTALWATFTQQIPSSVFNWQLAAFGGVLVLNIINLMFCSTPVQYNCNVLLTLIHGVAFATDCLIEAQITPVVMSWGGHMFLPLRYVQWMHTTPTMLLIMSMMSDLSAGQVAVAVVADLVMLVTGLAASWADGWIQTLTLTASFLGFVVVLRAIIYIFKSAVAESSTAPSTKKLLIRMLGLTLVVWSMFPLVWLAAYGGFINIVWEQVLWGVSDYSAKVVFSSHLWQKNLSQVQQRREAAQELMGALDRGLLLERVRNLNASKEKLVYALSHELRAPVNGMLALVQELLHNKTQSSASRTKMLMMIRSSASCLLNTINTTVSSSAGADSSSVVAAMGSKRLHKVNLYRVADVVLRLTRPMMKEHVRLINCISRDMPPVKADSMRLMQALMNLVCTCLKFTHTGDIKVSATATHSTAHVVVAYTGDGLTAAQLQQALNPFEYADGEAADVWDVCRSGLGLYLVQQALSSMGSSIDASSELHKGCTFRFELALADEECDSESDLEHTDMFSEAGSLRASLEMTELDSWRVAAAAAASDSSQARSSTDFSCFPGSSRLAPSSTTASTFMLPSVSGTNTTASSVASFPTTAAAAAAAAAGGLDFMGMSPGHNSDSKPQQLQQQGAAGSGHSSSLSDLTTASAAAAVAAASSRDGLIIGPQKPSHRSKHNGVIQVLSVDDDPVNQLVASTSLKSNKWEVVKSMSGSAALSWLEGADCMPDLVLLDVMMPSMSGFEVASRVREVYPSSLLPIIMVSAKTEEDDIVKGLHCGADDYITKPFKRAELSARIRAHIRARDAFVEQQAVEQQWLMQHNLLPANVQKKLRAGETVIAESHRAATVLWAEVVGGPAAAAAHVSSDLRELPSSVAGSPAVVPGSAALPGGDRGLASVAGAGGLTPAEAVVTLNSLYTTWEELCAQQGVLGVDFSGSTFVAVSGHDDNPQHLSLILHTAQAMLAVASGMTHADGSPLAVKLGIHLGPLTTGLVGSKALKLVLMGNTVEVAKQLAASSSPGGCHVSAAVHEKMQVLTADLQAAAAAAVPWTLQQLPGSDARQHSYMLWNEAGGSAVAGAANALLQQQQQQQQEERVAVHGSGDGLGLRSNPQLTPLATVTDVEETAGLQQQGSAASGAVANSAAAAAAAAAPAATAAAGSAAAAAAAIAHEVSSGRLSRFLRVGSKTVVNASAGSGGSSTAAAHSGSSTVADHQASISHHVPLASEATSTPQQQQQQQWPQATATSPSHGSSSGSPLRPQQEQQPAVGSSRSVGATLTHSEAASSSSSPPVATALPPPPPGGTVGFAHLASWPGPSRVNSSNWPSMSSRDIRQGLGASDSASSGPISAVQQGVAEPPDDNWLLADATSSHNTSSNLTHPQQQQPTPAAAAATAATAVAAPAAQIAAQPPTGTGGVPPQHAGFGGPPSMGAAAAAQGAAAAAAVPTATECVSSSQQQQQQQQQQQSSSAADLMHQLTLERRDLQQQMLLTVQQHAAAAAELAIVRQQLSDAQVQISSQSVVVDELKQQLGQAVVRAYLSDCLRALLQMKSQIESIAAVPGTSAQRQQQQRRFAEVGGLNTLPGFSLHGAGSSGAAAAAAAVAGSRGGGDAAGGDAVDRSAVDPAAEHCCQQQQQQQQNWLATGQVAQLAALQQQQISMLTGLLQQGMQQQQQQQQVEAVTNVRQAGELHCASTAETSGSNLQ